jgi:diguanylate cyclase (GGDEF)-like protein
VDPTAPGRHFAGAIVDMAVRPLAEAGVLDDVLRRAGETRGLDELCDPGGWSTYEQFRALLEAAAEVLGGLEPIAEMAPASVAKPTMPDVHALIMSMGTPDALFGEILEAGGASIIPISHVEGEQVTSGEWLLSPMFRGGHEPFRAYCAFTRGLFASIPRLFGLRGEVVEEQCVCDGHERCVYRVRWDESTGASVEFYKAKVEVLDAQLASLQATVGDLVSGDPLQRVLERIIEAAARTVNAPCFVLALDDVLTTGRKVYAQGLEQDDAERVARALANDGTDENEQAWLVVDIASQHRRHGRLAAINPGGQFFRFHRAVLEDYGRLAAAALESAIALEDARRQASTARVLLELSTSLANVVATDEMATTLARAIPVVTGCDRSLVVLKEPGASNGRIVSTCGYPGSVSDWLRSIDLPVPPVVHDEVIFFGRDYTSVTGILEQIMERTGSSLFATIPIVVEGEVTGFVVADAVERPERLQQDPELRERLRGLAAQAATAVRNARLLDQVRHQALHDPLTDLPNRGLIYDRVERMLARSRRTGTPCAALFIDLDGFKDVNDAFGHDAGDELLRAVAGRLAGILRESDTLGRLGGDEFVVLVEDCSLDGGAEFVAHRILESLHEPVVLLLAGGKEVRVTASIGIASGVRDNPNDLLRDADVALYEAKAAGKDRYAVFEPTMQAVAQERRSLEFDIRIALEREEYMLVYQPILDLRSGSVTGLEALLRWNHPERGVVEPEHYIPILERTGQIVDVGRWVLREACRQMTVWHAEGYPLDVSVNVSPVQLDSDSFVRDVSAVLAVTGLDPSRLVLEVTETSVMRDVEGASARLSALKALGVRVAIDDFGTGWSSLAVLQQLPIDLLKIDRSFVQTMLEDSHETTPVIDALLRLGKTMGLETLAEGIEELGQFSRLKAADCDSGQGFLFARPLEAGRVPAFLDAQVLANVDARN